MLQGRFTWQEGNYTTSQHDQVFAVLQEHSGNNLMDEQGEQHPLILGSKGEHTAVASQENTRCLPGSGNNSKKCNSPFWVFRLCRQLWTIWGYLCADVAPPLAKLILRRRKVIRTSINIHLHFLSFVAQETISDFVENEDNRLFTTFKEHHFSFFPKDGH